MVMYVFDGNGEIGLYGKDQIVKIDDQVRNGCSVFYVERVIFIDGVGNDLLKDCYDDVDSCCCQQMDQECELDFFVIDVVLE